MLIVGSVCGLKLMRIRSVKENRGVCTGTGARLLLDQRAQLKDAAILTLWGRVSHSP